MALRFLYRLVRRVVELVRSHRVDAVAKDAEILVLRHQLAVLRRQVARPPLHLVGSGRSLPLSPSSSPGSGGRRSSSRPRPSSAGTGSSCSPDRFEATRTAADASRRASGYTHLPFAGGPRACIGEHLAMAELVAAVSALLATYRLRSQLDSPNIEVDLALRPKGELPCLFEVL